MSKVTASISTCLGKRTWCRSIIQSILYSLGGQASPAQLHSVRLVALGRGTCGHPPQPPSTLINFHSLTVCVVLLLRSCGVTAPGRESYTILPFITSIAMQVMNDLNSISLWWSEDWMELRVNWAAFSHRFHIKLFLKHWDQQPTRTQWNEKPVEPLSLLHMGTQQYKASLTHWL